ncbi:restriction endonuclease subunit S [Aeromonas veronii]
MIAAEPKTTGQYQPYPEYKDSGVEWYKNIPAGWNIERFKFAVRKLESGTSVNAVDTPAEASQIGVLKTSAVYTGVFRHSENKAVVESDLTRVSCPVQKGCLIVSRMNTPDLVGAAGLVAETVDNLYLPDRLWQVHFVEKHAKFFHYWTLTPEYRNQVRLVCSGTSSSMQNLSQEQFLNFLVPSPSDDEKNSIAAFLDYETARIDRLVAQQQRLIGLLKEKRQSVISHAVTKGLNPDARMKDSGIEWLGEVPAHWNRTKLKHITHQIVDAEHKTAPYFDDGEYLVCRTTNVRDGKLRLDGGKYTNLEIYEKWTERGKPEAGDILFTREAPAGEACVYDGDIPLCLGQRMVLFKLDQSRVSPEFILHSIYSGLADAFVKQLSQGSTVVHFNMADIQNIPLFEPSLDEQELLVEHLSRELAKYDNLTTSAFKAIEFMQERRTALISAAVTGKIDLRDWTQPAEEVAA